MFSTAAKRRAEDFNRSMLDRWLDLWDLNRPAEKEELHFEGLKEPSQNLHQLLQSASARSAARM